MASDEKAPAPAAPAVQTIVLRVSIHCQGCKKKVRKVLKSVEGVHNVAVDGAQNMVTVTGTVDANTLVRRLYKSGKQAVLCHPTAAAAGATKPEAAPEALPAPPAGDGGKDDAAASKKSEEQPVKEPQAESSEKKPEAEMETESEKKAEKEETKPSDEAKKDGGESEAPEPKAKGAESAKEATAVAAQETGIDEDEANKKKNKPKDAGRKEPADAAAERSLSPAPAAKHAHEEYYPYYAQQPVLSYHMAQPSASLSYYAPRPEQGQHAFSVQQPQLQPVQQPQLQPVQQWSPSYLYMPYPQTAPESYYHDYYSPSGTHSSPPPPPPPLQDSYRIFDDENPNSCSIM